MYNPERVAAYQASDVILGGHNVVAIAKISHNHNHISFPQDGAGETFVLLKGYADNAKIMLQFPNATYQEAADEHDQLNQLLNSEPGASIVIWENANAAVQFLDTHNA